MLFSKMTLKYDKEFVVLVGPSDAGVTTLE